VETRLESDEIFVDPAGVVVNSKWIAALRKFSSGTDNIGMGQFSREQNLRPEAALHLLKRFVGGLYNPRTDSFTPRLRQNTS
jgi:hypothetical protein